MNDRSRPKVAPETSTKKSENDSTAGAGILTNPKAVAPAYVVFTFHDDGRIKRRNVFVSLHSTIKAKERAEAKGAQFELMLCELVPVPGGPMIVVGLGGGDR